MPDLPERFCNLRVARARFGDRVDRLGAYLTVGDPAADAAVAALAPGPGTSALIGRALDGEAAGVPAPLRELIDHARIVPPWVEWDRADRGGRFFLRTGIVGGIVLGTRSLVLGYASPAGNKPLVLSGRLREAAAPRLHETARFVRAVVQSGGMRPGAEGWQITLRVRLMHAQVRRMILASGTWRGESWGLPINQHDMVATSLLFSVVMIDGVRRLGIDVRPDESDDFMHLWRWISHVMGVDAALMPTSEAEGYRLGELIFATQGPPDDDSRALTAALLEHGLAHPHARQRELARRTIGVARALGRYLLDDELADRLGLPLTRERFLLPAGIATIRALEQARARSKRLNAEQYRRGARYWDEVLKKGLAYATIDFQLPERLRAQ